MFPFDHPENLLFSDVFRGIKREDCEKRVKNNESCPVSEALYSIGMLPIRTLPGRRPGLVANLVTRLLATFGSKL